MKWFAGLHPLRLLALAAVPVALVALLAWGAFRRPQQESPTKDEFPLTPLSPSPFVNTRPEAQFVGSETCRPCHPGAFASFAHTGMGRSMGLLHPDQEPPDGIFDHPLSGRRYEIYRKDDQLWHREWLLADGKAEVVLAGYPLRWVVGSGRHSRAYLAEIDGFLVESPITWYSRAKNWGMSPGYDIANQVGFERAVGEACLTCHAGQAKAVEGTHHRMRIDEPTIGCERCHGPGSVHVKRWEDQGPSAKLGFGEIDYTIVNPQHLPRELSDAVCQQCHLTSDARLLARGRAWTDIRPGLPLQDVLQQYTLRIPDAPMKVVGHAEQLRSSRCYQASQDLTCTTCHNPHGTPRPRDHVDYYRTACMVCHEPASCRVDPARRQKESPENDCVHCHMPTVPTDIQHHAFTHHRIGIHSAATGAAAEAKVPARRAGVLEPYHDMSRFSNAERCRSLGVAYAELGSAQKDRGLQAVYDRRAGELLRPLVEQGLQDAVAEYILYMIANRADYGMDVQHAEKSLTLPSDSIQYRCEALLVVARARMNQGRWEEARGLLQEVTHKRRDHRDWILLAACEENRHNKAGAVKALETALRINTRLPAMHQTLAEHYRRLGDFQRAGWHNQRASQP